MTLESKIKSLLPPTKVKTDVLAHPEIPWDYAWLSSNESITMSDVLAHPETPWNYMFLSSNKSITMSDVLAHPEIPWDYAFLSSNESITISRRARTSGNSMELHVPFEQREYHDI